ncbi:MAG TPA: DUF3108 domain-containing protein [Steroidobacteraceae bacterium]|nr:DUF3108 domain-containing protein [Steroidobacteraceae bacterium]
MRPACARIAAALLIAAGFASAASAASDAASATAATGDEAGIAPFSAHYVAQWKDISVASSDLVLKRAPGAGSWVYTWRISARGIFRLFYKHDVVQTSWFRVRGALVRPQKYQAVDGASHLSVRFDWRAGRVRGTVAGKPLDIAVQEGTQDIMSIQVQVMRDLQQGNLPARFWILDKDKIKDFEYTREGGARLRTELGELDTVVVASRRVGDSRVLRMWFAPSLNFVPVQAERRRDGKLEFAMRIQKLQR